MIRYTVASDLSHLTDILDLQKVNVSQAITEQERKEQGFVTCRHDIDLLDRMNRPFPHIIALDDSRVVGYALVMLSAMREEIDVLKPMFEQIDQLSIESKPLMEVDYFIMGQVCVGKAYRGQGLFNGLYEHLRHQMSSSFNVVITEVSAYNTRSLRAHYNQGFKLLKKYTAPDGHPWELIYWDWT